MSVPARYSLKKGGSIARRVAYALLFAVLGYVCLLLAADAEGEGRVRLLRYWTLLSSAVFAISVPHVLLPDPDVQLLQRLNRPPRRLLIHQARLWCVVPIGFVVPGFLLAFYHPGAFGQDLALKSRHLLETLPVVLGVAVYSFERYVSIGPASQAWQEGTRGRWWRAMSAHSTTPLQVPGGLVPALTATARVFTVGMLVLTAGAYISQTVSPAGSWVPGMMFLGWSGLRLARLAPAYDRVFYATNAFYTEIFRRAGGVHLSDRAPIPYNAVYWVPRRWKPPVWASLLQLDRALPLGRFIALGHALLWLFFFQGVEENLIVVYLLLFIIAKNGASFLLVTKPFAPLPFQIVRQAPVSWVVTRFLVNLRWTLPFLLSLLLVASLTPFFAYTSAWGWVMIDIFMAFLTALFFTYATEFHYRRRFG